MKNSLPFGALCKAQPGGSNSPIGTVACKQQKRINLAYCDLTLTYVTEEFTLRANRLETGGYLHGTIWSQGSKKVPSGSPGQVYFSCWVGNFKNALAQ